MRRFACLSFALVLAACGAASRSPAPDPASSPVGRQAFLGAFFRPVGAPPFGVFSVYSKNRAPEPYPAPKTTLFGAAGYCDEAAANGVSISDGYLVDAAKLRDLVELGAKWARTPVWSDFDDRSHVDGPGRYAFADFDSAQCALLRHGVTPVVEIPAGVVQYNAVPGQYSPQPLPNYRTAADYGAWCGAVAAHEAKAFPAVHRFSVPGNEVNTDTKTFPGGAVQIAAYARACYAAVKRAEPHAFVYGLELNMDKNVDPLGFVQRLYDLGCRTGTCYDGLSIHLFLPYPVPDPETPCYPSPGGAYGSGCVKAIRAAAHAPALHVLIGETAFMIPSTVPDEATKAKAVVAALQLFAADPAIDGVVYANVDECDLYASGYFVGGCLVDSVGSKLPAYTALQSLARAAYR